MEVLQLCNIFVYSIILLHWICKDFDIFPCEQNTSFFPTQIKVISKGSQFQHSDVYLLVTFFSRSQVYSQHYLIKNTWYFFSMAYMDNVVLGFKNVKYVRTFQGQFSEKQISCFLSYLPNFSSGIPFF